MKKVWPQELYQRLNICDLILISLRALENSGKKITFERLLKECFDLFPKKFNFLEYPKLPDARKLDRPLRTLRKQKMILGNPKEEFLTTEIGKSRALGIMNLLRQKKLKLK